MNWWELGTDIAITTATAGLAKGVPNARIGALNLSAGSGNYNAIYEATANKLEKEIIKNVTVKTTTRSMLGLAAADAYRTGFDYSVGVTKSRYINPIIESHTPTRNIGNTATSNNNNNNGGH